jgi:hypothetical protein
MFVAVRITRFSFTSQQGKQMVAITPDGWRVGPASFRFRRGSGYGALPEPARGGSMVDLKALPSVFDKTFALLTPLGSATNTAQYNLCGCLGL